MPLFTESRQTCILSASHVGEYWVVQFTGRAGGQARAVLSSEQQARQFAERHAYALTTAGVPLKWLDANEADGAVLTTIVGSYRIFRVAD